MKINFNEPVFLGSEIDLIKDAISRNKISGDGYYTKMVEKELCNLLNCKNLILTSSCTHSLEIIPLIEGWGEADEVIVPSYTFVSSALAFDKFNMKIKFADIDPEYGNITYESIKNNLSENTKAIVVVHYAGRITPDIEKIKILCRENKIKLIEDSAQAIGSSYNHLMAGTIGDYGCFSFHETKNITSAGEGGCLIVKDDSFFRKAMIAREKGTNRSEFYLGLVDKYSWKAKGSSYLMSDISAAYLFPQVLNLELINNKRKALYLEYQNGLKNLKITNCIKFPDLAESDNGHMFFILVNKRRELLDYLRTNGIEATFHYLPLETSDYIKGLNNNNAQVCFESQVFSSKLIRLPLHFNLTIDDVNHIISIINKFEF
jgi:dTDP-4-amino-4,6-dideoxygalactose transaminase